MAAKLVAEEGTLKGLVLSLEEGDQWVIGRDPDSCQLLIEDPVASRRHLICRTTPEGILLENLSSTNPVLINHEEVNEPQILSNGDIVKIGSCTYRFYSESEARLFNEGADALPTEEENEEDNAEEEKNVESPDTPEDEVSGDKHAEESFAEELVEDVPIEEDAEESDVSEEEIELEQEVDENLSEELSEEISATDEAHDEIFSEDDLVEDEFEESTTIRRDTIFDEEAAEEEALLADINFDTVEPGRWLLKIIGGSNTGAEFTMSGGSSYTIGTDPKSCDVILNDTSISRQHARVSISDEDIITIEDLRSRNGTLVDGKQLKEKQALEPNDVVNMGTSAFVIFDKEGEMHTVISPLLPSIVKVLQKDEQPAHPSTDTPKQKEDLSPEEQEMIPHMIAKEIKEEKSTNLTAFLLIAMVTGVFVLMGIGMVTLFQENPVELHETTNINELLAEALAPFPGVDYTYNKTTGTLMIVGHVLTDNAKRQLMYNLQGLKFIKRSDDTGIVIDEKVWQELNPTLARNPDWRSITLQAAAPGQFVLTGYLKTRDQMEKLVEYMSRNFLYLDKLQYRVVVEEDVITKVKLDLAEAGMPNINVTINNGDLVLQGVIPSRLHDDFEKVLAKVIKIPGLRKVQDFVTEIEESRSMIDITDRYLVTGVSKSGRNVSVVIDGRIVSKGDNLDGMVITEISPKSIILEKDNVTYRIDLRP
ncbi:MAG: type III secretion system inner membrane ring subunit SctD [Chlamydiota bacterium]|nr:type III secretion system inner membrane ring subunit SctD [Chlamydiota bacterium]